MAAKDDIFSILHTLIESFLGDLLLLRMTGAAEGEINGVLWYISAMIISMAVLYPLLRKWTDIMGQVLVPLTSILIVGFLHKTYGSLLAPHVWMGFAYKGLLRGFADIGLGVVAFSLTGWIRNLKMTKAGEISLTLAKWGMYFIITCWMLIARFPLDVLCLLFFTVAISISFSRCGIDKDVFQKNWAISLGRFSMPLYLSHVYYAKYLNNILPDSMSRIEVFSIYIVAAFATAFAVKGISSIWNTYKTQIARIFVMSTKT